MTTRGVGRRHDVKEERLNVKVEGLVAQEQLGQQAEALAILLVAFPANLEHGDRLLPVDFVACGTQNGSIWNLAGFFGIKKCLAAPFWPSRPL